MIISLAHYHQSLDHRSNWSRSKTFLMPPVACTSYLFCLFCSAVGETLKLASFCYINLSAAIVVH